MRPESLSRFPTCAAVLVIACGLNNPVSAAADALFATSALQARPATGIEVKSKPTAIALNREKLSRVAKADELSLELPNGEKHQVVFDRIEDHGGGIRSRVGYLKGLGNDHRVIITTGPDGSFGSIRGEGRDYRIVPGINGDILVDMVEERALVPPIDLSNDALPVPGLESHAHIKHKDEKAVRLKAGTNESGQNFATPTPQATVDLMFVYTNGVAASLGSNLVTRLYNLVTAANTAFADSEVAITLRMVHAMQVTYPDVDCGDNKNATLNAITPGVGGGGAFAGVEARRNAVGADIVAFLGNGPDNTTCGVAWLTTTSTSVSADFMYSVTIGCLLECDQTFIHEVGHNMGNHHDRATVAFHAGGVADASLSGGAYPYSFGHFFCNSGALTCNPNLPPSSGGCTQPPGCTAYSNNNVGTIMSYFLPTTLKFSNPNLMCAPRGGGGVLQPCGVAGSADNALSMNNLRFLLQGVKASTVPAPTGAMQLAAGTYAGVEGGSAITVTVRRIGGSSGTISVDYVTQNGTAIAGTDFVSASGTLTWMNGDTADKTFQINLINDGMSSVGRTFTVALQNAGGATGSFVGVPSGATVTIVASEAFPPDCNIPAGWTFPLGSIRGWSTATDRARTGACSLKSNSIFNATADGQANTSKAQVTITGNFQAGTVNFYYSVSSELDFDCFRFLIDNVQQAVGGTCWHAGGMGASGDQPATNWTLVSIPLSAGNHTLTWSYDKGTFTRAGFDAAWIDDVTLPLFVPVTLTVTNAGTGTVTGTGINCGGDCMESVQPGTQFTLTAIPSAGSVFTGWSGGGCSGTGTCVVTVSANTTVTATFTALQFMLGITKSGSATGTVTSNVGGLNCGVSCSATITGGTMVTLTATPAMGSAFAGWNGGGCGMANPCIVNLIAATTVNAKFDIVVVAPGAPTLGSITAGNTQATVFFAPPASDGGALITSYSVQCLDAAAVQPPATGNGATSPINITSMVNGVTYSCRVAATNSAGPGPDSNQLSVTPSATPAFGFVSADSRKTHGGMTKFKIPIAVGPALNGAITVEPRSASSHEIVFTFNGTVTAVGSVTISAGTANASFAGNEVSVALSGVADLSRVAVTLNGVNGSVNQTVNLAFMVGDVTNSRSVSAVDIAAIKSRSGNMVTNDAQARFDIMTIDVFINHDITKG